METEEVTPDAGSRRSTRAVGLVAPALLLLVATAQLAVAHRSNLSPWKGAGFGMFSTVDAPDARFLRIYLVSGDELTPVVLPAAAQSLWLRARTWPTHQRLERIADIVATGTWIPYRFSRAQARYERLADDEGSMAHDGSATTGPTVEASPTEDDARPPGVGVSFEGFGLYRMVGEEEAPPPPEDILSFDEVRLELWTYRFSTTRSGLVAEPTATVTVSAGGA